MSLFTSLQLIRDVSHSVSPRNRGEEASNSLISSIKFHSPKHISQDIPSFSFPEVTHKITITKSNLD